MLATFQSKMERSRKLAAYVSAGVADDVDEDEDGDEKEADNDDDDDTNDLSWSVRALCMDCFFSIIAFVFVSVLKVLTLTYDFCITHRLQRKSNTLLLNRPSLRLSVYRP